MNEVHANTFSSEPKMTANLVCTKKTAGFTTTFWYVPKDGQKGLAIFTESEGNTFQSLSEVYNPP